MTSKRGVAVGQARLLSWPLSILILAIGLAAIGWYIWTDMNPRPGKIVFDRRAWLEHSGADEKNNPRYEMVHDVISILEERVMTRSEVIDLLGPPSTERMGRIYYHLGWWGSIDPRSLVIHFDSEGHIDSIKVDQG